MEQEYLGIRINTSKDTLLSSLAIRLLEQHYMIPNEEKSPQQAFARAAVFYSQGDLKFAQRIYDYASNLWFMFASPVLSNASASYFKSIGLPISCYVQKIEDSLESLIYSSSEFKWLSVKGGGVGQDWSGIRAVSNKAPGPIPFIASYDRDVLAFKQGTTRRSSVAVHLDVSHPDILEFISNLRIPTGGDVNRKGLNLHNAVSISDKFLYAVKKDMDWDLIDPHTKSVFQTIRSRDLWQLILETRFRTGEPYIFYKDEANRRLPESLKRKGLKIHSSNLCQEVMLPTNTERTAVCCLSSLNVEFFDDWKGTRIVEDLILFLNNVLDKFIELAPDNLSRAIQSAKRERSLGLGAMGLNSYFKRKKIPFSSLQAKLANETIFKTIFEKAKLKSLLLAQKDGCYPDGKDYIIEVLDKEFPHKEYPNPEDAHNYGRRRYSRKLELISEVGRNAHLIAIAPNANNSLIVGCSPSVEPSAGNAYNQQTRVGNFLVKCKYLKKRLKELDKDTDEVWQDIVLNNGSVQHLSFLTQDDKAIFKTAYELDQRVLVDLARDRQKYICQGQSINLFFPFEASKEYVNKVHLRAFSTEGTGVPLKSLYYLRTESEHYASKISKQVEREALEDFDGCLSCEG